MSTEPAADPPPRAKVRESAKLLKEMLADPCELLAYAALRAHYAQPPRERLVRGAEAIRTQMPDASSAVSLLAGPGLAQLQKELGRVQADLARSAEGSEGLADTVARLQARCTDLERALAKAASAAKDDEAAFAAREAAILEARQVARNLWSAMPAEGKVAYFESGEDWLPDWIRQR